MEQKAVIEHVIEVMESLETLVRREICPKCSYYKSGSSYEAYCSYGYNDEYHAPSDFCKLNFVNSENEFKENE